MTDARQAAEALADGRLVLDWPAPHLARLTLANPAKRNALDHAILDALTAVVPGLAERGARCLLLTGSGPVFSAGYDIGGLPRDEFADRAEELVAHPFTAALDALEAFTFPSVCALNGPALGGGLELALVCDLRIAVAGASFAMPPAKLGLIYSHTGLRRFIDTIGAPRTRELFLVGRRVSARNALAWGMVNDVVESEELEEAALDLAGEIAANAPISLEGNKRIIRELLAAEGELDLETEQELVALRESCFTSRDFFEGVRAFEQKRPPRWTGT